MTLIDISTAPATAPDTPEAAPRQEEIAASGLKLKRAKLIDISEQLAVMLDAGVRVADALRCCHEQAELDDDTQLAALLAIVAGAVESGDELSAVLAEHPRAFPRVYVALVKAGEKSGLMNEMLQRAVGYLRDEQEILQKVRGAMTYPLIMFGFAIMTTVSLLVFVLPKFTVIYKGKEDRLPVPTKILIFLSDALVHHWMIVVPAVLGGAFLAWQWLQSERGRGWWHATQLRLPVLGPMYRRLHLSRGLRMLGTLNGAGVQLVEALETAKDLATNTWYRALWEDVATQIRAGRPVSEPLRSTDLARALVPPSTAQMVKAGETGGQLAEVAQKVAGHAERELKSSVEQVTRLIEPAMIVVMGGLIGGIVMALLLPVMTVGRAIAE